MNKLFLFLISAAVFVSCQKQEVNVFQEPNALAFYRAAVGEFDSLNYSFATTGVGKNDDTLFLKMRVVGAMTDYERAVKLKPLSSTTARENVDYTLPEYNIPAGVSIFQYPLVLHKTPKMQDEVLRLELEPERSELFPNTPAIGLEPSGNTVSLKSIKIDISDMITKPTWWISTHDNLFGTYSNVKYKFMISILKTGDFRTISQGGTWTTNEYNSAKIKLQNELAKYEAANGPLIDENGTQVVF